MTNEKPPRSKKNGQAFLSCLKRVKQMSKGDEIVIENENLLESIDRYLEIKEFEKEVRNDSGKTESPF